MPATIDDLYTFSARSGVTIREACIYTARQFDLGNHAHKMSNAWASKLRKQKVKTVHPEKLEALERALIELAGDAGTLPVTTKAEAHKLGVKKLIGRMA